MSDLKFYGLIDYNKVYRDKNVSKKELFEFLHHKNFFEIKSIKEKKSLCRLNGTWNGDRHDRREHIFASNIFNDKCYFISEEYLEEVSSLILRLSKNKATIDYVQSKELYKIENEAFNDIASKNEFYQKELDQLIDKKKALFREFGNLVYEANINEFNKGLKNHIKKEIHSNSEFNFQYVTWNDPLEDMDFLNDIRFNSDIFSINDRIDFIKSELRKKDLKSADIETFTIHEAVCFFEVIGFLKLDEGITYTAQAKIISKLIGKNMDNIRKKIRLYDSKDKNDKDKIEKITQKIQNEIKKMKEMKK